MSRLFNATMPAIAVSTGAEAATAGYIVGTAPVKRSWLPPARPSSTSTELPMPLNSLLASKNSSSSLSSSAVEASATGLRTIAYLHSGSLKTFEAHIVNDMTGFAQAPSWQALQPRLQLGAVLLRH